MCIFIVDIEGDAPSPMTGSMVCLGAVKVNRELDKTFYGETAPISEYWNPQALAISNISREDHLAFPDPEITMIAFNEWVLENNKDGRPVLVSDNNGYDAMWITCYFDKYGIKNPFGWSSRRIGDMYAGLMKDGRARWKHLRNTKHTHHPVDDVKGNAEALIKIIDDYGLKLNLK